MADTIRSGRRSDVLPRRARARDDALTASAQVVFPDSRLRLFNLTWQNEGWSYYRTGGTVKYGINWRAQAMSRVRLSAAILPHGAKKPELIDSGPAAEIMARFFNGAAGQAGFMESASIQLDVPGEFYVVMTTDETTADEYRWYVKSANELRVAPQKVKLATGQRVVVNSWSCLVEQGVWETLPPETHVFKMWHPDQQWSYMADSPMQGVMRNLRIIDLLERRLMSQAVSRLASNGLLLYPQEQTFIPKPGYDPASGLDPFTWEWLEIAAKTIENPGSALAALPMPVKVPKEMIQYWQHMDFANSYDERVSEILEKQYDRVATGLNLPKEMITGVGDTSHWNAWALDEQAIKIHISPSAEEICAGIGVGYFYPTLMAEGLSPITPEGRLLPWYDPSDLLKPPDMSNAAEEAYGNDEISGEAYRRLKGLDEGDKPTKTQLREQLLLKMAKDPGNAAAAIEELTGAPVAGASTGPGGEDGETSPDEPTPATGPPDQPTEQPARPAAPPRG
jgi:hypothetical protein